MAKELPYFKFEPNAWENGNIQMLSREDKGLFIDLCSMYWSRLGDLPKKLAVQKLCAGNATALNSLCEENIIEVIDGNVYIKFLTIQLDEFENTRITNSKNAKEGWEKRRKQKELRERNATALNSQSETDAIREEEIREEKMKEDDKPPTAKQKSFKSLTEDEFKHSLVPFVQQFGKNTVRDFFDYWTEPTPSGKMRFQLEKAWDAKRRLTTWKRKEKDFGNTPDKEKLKTIPAGVWNV